MIAPFSSRDPLSRIVSRAPALGGWDQQQLDPFNFNSSFSSLAPMQSSGAFRLFRQLGISELLSCDIAESPTSFVLAAELPGCSLKDVQISIEGNVLSIQADRRSTYCEDDMLYHTREMVSGRVSRSFELPQDAVLDKVDARFVNGILHVTVPKALTTPPSQGNRRTVQITEGADDSSQQGRASASASSGHAPSRTQKQRSS